MHNTKFEVYEMSIDYSLLGEFPENIDKIKNDEELLNLFMDCFRLTFSNTVFSYYGDLEESRVQIEDSLILDEIEFKKRNNREKWQILLLVVIDMFFRMHNTYLAQETIQEVCDSFDEYTEEERFTVIHDLNFALFFGIEECVSVSPSQIRNLKASDEDTALLPSLLDNKDILLKIIKDEIKSRDIVKPTFEELFKTPLNKTYGIHIYDGFISSWIEMMELPEEVITESDWEMISTSILAITQTYFSLIVNNEIILNRISEKLYYYIANLYKTVYELEYPIYKIPS